MENEEEIMREVVLELDERLGYEMEGTEMKDRIEEIQKELKEDKAKTDHQLKLLGSLSKSSKNSFEADKYSSEAENARKESVETIQKMGEYVGNAGETFVKLEKRLTEVRMVRQCCQYLRVVKRVEEHNSSIQSCMLVDKSTQAIDHFLSLLSLAQSIKETDCKKLLAYCQDMVVYWYNILFSALTKQLDKHTNYYHWPFIVTSSQPSGNQANAKHANGDDLGTDLDPEHLAAIVKQLCRLQLPATFNSKVTPILSFHHSHRPLSLPLQVLLSPFDIRFKFHFQGSKKTNCIDKPEWYFTQLHVWLNDHHDFISTTLQPAFPSSVYVFPEFVSGLCCMASEKLKSDLQQLTYNTNNRSNTNNNRLIAHHIDEALAFFTEVSSFFPSTTLSSTTTFSSTPSTSFPFPSPSCLSSVLTDEAFFNKWISLEKDYALKKMDMMFETADAWFTRLPEEDDVTSVSKITNKQQDNQPGVAIDYKIPQFSEQFLVLLMTILDRYRNLPVLDSQLHFVDLHLELIDDFRIRLVQLRKQAWERKRDVTGEYAAILNTVSFFTDLLTRWNNKPIFIKLNYHKRILEGVKNDEDGLWEGMVKLYERMVGDMGSEVVGCVVASFKELSRDYRKDKWLALPSHKDYIAMSLSSSACGMLNQLKVSLHDMQQSLNKVLFETLWQDVAAALDLYIFEEIILTNHFNEGGATQLAYDMTRNLFPIFHYTNKPENYFSNVKEACHVLSLTSGSAMLIRDVLKRALHPMEHSVQVTDPVAALSDLGVSRLSPEVVYRLISLRIDLQYG